MKRAALALFATLSVWLAITAYALEADGVAVVASARPDGAPRETHVWFAQIDGEIWLEAGAPENGWYADALANPHLMVAFEGGPRAHYRALPDETPAAQQRVRAALRAKYGWRDAWVGMLVDASRSVAVRLAPEA